MKAMSRRYQASKRFHRVRAELAIVALALGGVSCAGATAKAPAKSATCCPSFIRISAPAPDAVLGPEHDVSPEPGLQVNIEVATSPDMARSALSLLVLDERLVPSMWPEHTVVEDTGRARFTNVTLPPGEFTIEVRSAGSCGRVSDAVELASVDRDPTRMQARVSSAAPGR
jgi:hypothetical protein